jgi:hypothetical protein
MYMHMDDKPYAYKRAVERKIASAKYAKAQRQAEARKAEFLAKTPDGEAFLARIIAEGQKRPDSFMGKMADSIYRWGALTEAQEAAVRKTWAERDTKQAERAAADANSQFVGEVGEREVFNDLTVTFLAPFNSIYGGGWIHGLKDKAGNVLIFMGQKLVDPKTGLYVEPGAVISLKATVKAHNVRDGVNQTIINRPVTRLGSI